MGAILDALERQGIRLQNGLNQQQTRAKAPKTALVDHANAVNDERQAIAQANSPPKYQGFSASATPQGTSALLSDRRAPKLDDMLDRIGYQKGDDLSYYDQLRYNDNFGGQFQANYNYGDLQQKSALAWNDYLKHPNDYYLQRAQAIDDTLARFQENNAEALDDDHVKAPWISKTAAGYLPQLKAQAAEVLPAIALGAIPGGSTGGKAGYVAGSAAYSYNATRGAAFKKFLDMGVDEETARAAANDEAIVSSLVEMAGAGLDVATVGVNRIIRAALSKGAAPAVKSLGQRLLRSLGAYGISVGGESMEEGLQGAISIANTRRAASDQGKEGALDLARQSANVMKEAFSGEDPQARQEILTQAREGGKIAMMMGLGTVLAPRLAADIQGSRQSAVSESADQNSAESLIAETEQGSGVGGANMDSGISAAVRVGAETNENTVDTSSPEFVQVGRSGVASSSTPSGFIQVGRYDAFPNNPAVTGSLFGPGRSREHGTGEDRRFITNTIHRDAAQGSANMDTVEQELLAAGKQYRGTVSLEQSRLEAENYIQENGGYDAVADAFLSGNQQTLTSAGDATVLKLLRHFSQQGDVSRTAAIAAKYSEIVSDQARALNMQKLLLMLSPEGALMQAERIVRQTNDRRHSDVALTEQDKADIMAIGQAMQDNAIPQVDYLSADLRQWMEQAWREAEAGNGSFQDFLSSKYAQIIINRLPSTGLQKFQTLQRISMLSNVRTYLSNLQGNIAELFGSIASQPFSNLGDILLSRITSERTATPFSLSGIAGGAKQGLNQVLAERRLGIDRVQHNRLKDGTDAVYTGRAFNPDMVDGKLKKTVYHALDESDRTIGFLLRLGDQPLYMAHYQQAVQQMTKAAGLTEPTAEIMQAAAESALRRTFQDSNALTQRLEQARRSMGVFGVVAAPFTRTPANVLKVTAEYSPVGLTEALVKTFFGSKSLQAVKKRGESTLGLQRQIAELIGRGAVGSAMILLGSLVGGAGDDGENAKEWLWSSTKGGDGSSVRIGDTYYDLSKIQSWTTAFLTGATAAEQPWQEEDGTFNWGKAMTIASRLGAGALEFPVLEGVRDLLSGAYDTENVALGVLGLLLEGGTQVIPFASMLRQVASATDPYVRTSASSRTGIEGVIDKSLLNPIKNLTPWGRKSLPIKYDALGNPIQNTAASSGWGRALNTLINPLNTQQANDSPVIDELDRLAKARGGSDVLPAVAPSSVSSNNTEYRLTTEDKQDWQKTQGQTLNQLLLELLDSPEYQQAGDEDRARMVLNSGNIAQDEAKETFLAKQGAAFKKGTLSQAADTLADQGIPYSTTLTWYSRFSNMSSSQEKRQALFEADGLTAEEKVAIGKALISENETVDYTNADTFAVSQLTEARQEKWNRFQEIGWTGEQYAKLFEVWQKTKAGTIKALMDTYGYTQTQAETIWRMVKNQ